MKKCVLSFFVIKDSLFALNQSLIFSSSLLTFVKQIIGLLELDLKYLKQTLLDLKYLRHY